jgi:hypothetical protein
MNSLKIAFVALAMVLATGAHAGDWPEVGNQFQLTSGKTLVVAKIKWRPDVDKTQVCLKDGGAPCTWSKMEDLQGKWVTYGKDED